MAEKHTDETIVANIEAAGGTVSPVSFELPGGGTYKSTGMSLRDWLAGQALTGLLAGQYRDTGRHNFSEVPTEAYAIADEMIAARAATGEVP